MIDVSSWQLPLIQSFTDLRYKTSKVMGLAKRKNKPIVIAKNNKPEAVLLSVATFEDFLSQIQRLQDQQDIIDSEKVLKSTKEKDWVSVEDAAEDLLGKGYVQSYLSSSGSKGAKKII